MNSNINERNSLQESIDKTLEEMDQEAGRHLDPKEINLAEFSRRTGLSRSRARTLKNRNFKVAPHGRTGVKAQHSVLADHVVRINELLGKGVTNSSVCFDRLKVDGYTGSLTTVKNYIKANMHLVPAKRKIEVSGQSRGRRYQTDPAEAYQMDWGFVEVIDVTGSRYKIACFAMVCHHCGTCFVEFFPNARQENLFIGMIHAFTVMGVPRFVLTDNMRSVVVRRDFEGKPIFQNDYAAFMTAIGFSTKLCKPRHPFTKGKVERLIRFVKGNFLAGREFINITQLNAEALRWCAEQGRRYRRALDCVPADKHARACLLQAKPISLDADVAAYLCPRRKISFDGFVNYEGRRFGVPFWYSGRDCRVSRDGNLLHIYSEDLSRELAVHPITWSRSDAFCEDQYADSQPLELPSVAPTTVVPQLEAPMSNPAFSKFDFGGRL